MNLDWVGLSTFYWNILGWHEAARHCFPSLKAVELWKQPQAAAAASDPFDSTTSHKETKIHIIFSCSRGNGECSWGHPRSCHQRYVIYSRPSACLKRRDDFDVVTCLNWGVNSPSSWSNSLRNLEMTGIGYHEVSWQLHGPPSTTTASFQRRTEHEQASRFLHGWLKIYGSLGYLVSQSGRVHQKIKC